jgi:hypothetical protein
MPKKNLLIFITLISLVIIGALIFDLMQSSKHKTLQSSIDDSYSVVTVDMDLDTSVVSTKDILSGQDPLLVVVQPSKNQSEAPSIYVIRNLTELAALNIHQNKTINQFDPIYKTLALAYLPAPKTAQQLFSAPGKFFSRDNPKIRIVPLDTEFSLMKIGIGSESRTSSILISQKQLFLLSWQTTVNDLSQK